MLILNGRGVSIPKSICYLCQLPLLDKQIKNEENMVVVWGCGHSFHANCLTCKEGENLCPLCQKVASPLPQVSGTPRRKRKDSLTRIRPDLEGHF